MGIVCLESESNLIQDLWALSGRRLDVERMPSFAPNTAARNQPMRPVRCSSFLPIGILEASLILLPAQVGQQAIMESCAQSHEYAFSFINACFRSGQSNDLRTYPPRIY